MTSSSSNLQQEWEELTEYLLEWAEVTFLQKSVLTTPVRVEGSKVRLDPQYESTIVARSGVRILFQPTRTGKAYQSFEEDRTMERKGMASRSTQPLQIKPEGGVEVLMELCENKNNLMLRIRARRCAMKDDTVVKEMSETTILKRLEEAIAVWNQRPKSTNEILKDPSLN